MLRSLVFFALCSTTAVLAGPQAPPAAKKNALPSDLAATLRQDLKAIEIQPCLDQHNLRFDQAVSTEWLNLNNTAGPVLLVQGVPPCLGNANNGPVLIYGQFGEGWRRMLYETGHQVQPLRSGTKGWTDLEVSEQQSPSESMRRVYRFDGFAYKAGGCRQVQVADASGQPLAKPVSKPCPR